MPPVNIAERDVNLRINIKKDTQNPQNWVITPSLTAYAAPQVEASKNIIFLLDVSGSMEGDRIALVKAATNNLLDQLRSEDSFSIIAFNNGAELIISSKAAKPHHIAKAKRKTNNLLASGSTNFASAFYKVAQAELIKNIDNATIIFLTDGGDASSTPSSLIAAVKNPEGKNPRIVPIGVQGCNKSLLDELAHQANAGRIPPIYINEITPNAFESAFQKAFNLACEQSQKSIEIEITISAKNKKNKKNQAELSITRELQKLSYSGEKALQNSFYFDSPEAPTECQVRMICDGIHLKAERRFAENERAAMATSPGFSTQLPKMKCVDHRPSSWAKCIAAIGFGLLALAGAAAFYLFFSPFTFLITAAIAGGAALIGAGSLLKGLYDLSRKTLFQPTKHAHLTHRSHSHSSSNIRAALGQSSAPPSGPAVNPSHKLVSKMGVGGNPSVMFNGVPASASTKPITGTSCNFAPVQ